MDESTTDAAVDTGAQDAQPVATESQQPAEQTTTETTNEETSSSESETSNEETQSGELVEWARKKGLPLSEQPTENELKLAEMQRNADKKIGSKSELQKTINESADAYGVPDDQLAAMQQEMQILKINQQLEQFYSENPEAKELDADMAKLVQESPQLANGGFEALYAVAKVRAEKGKDKELKEQGGREALQSLAQKQKAAGATASATTHETSSNITLDQVRERTRAGDVDWIRKNQAAINALGA